MRLELQWTSDALGTVSINTLQAASVAVPFLVGKLRRVIFTPDSGATQPTALYDATILDDDSQDMLAGNGANLDNTNGNDLRLNPEVVWVGKLRPQISNAGAANKGTIKMYYERGD
jgi:hypothetical protein